MEGRGLEDLPNSCKLNYHRQAGFHQDLDFLKDCHKCEMQITSILNELSQDGHVYLLQPGQETEH